MVDKNRYTSGIQAGTGKIVTMDPVYDGLPLSIIDGDLEVWVGTTSLVYWPSYQDGTGGTVNQESTEKKVGSYSAKLTYGTGGQSLNVYQSHFASPYNGKDISVGCWCKSANTSPNDIMLLFYDIVSGSIKNMGVAYYQNSGNWEYLVTTIPVDNIATYIYIQLRIEIGVNAPVYFDSVSGVVGKATWDGANGLTVDLASTYSNKFKPLQIMLNKSVNAGKFATQDIVSTYSLLYSVSKEKYRGGVLAPNGDIHFVPYSATVGQKVNYITGTVSTYSLLFTAGEYFGGVLAPNGNIHFIPYYCYPSIGQKINYITGVVSTYSLAQGGYYHGGVLAPNGDIHMSSYDGYFQKENVYTGLVSTYTVLNLLYYSGAVLAPNGDVHFIPCGSTLGQKISAAGMVSTYTFQNEYKYYQGGVLAPNGDIHFVPYNATAGQKISSSGVVSTYTLVAKGPTHTYSGGVLAPNGDIHFIPDNATVGQKVNSFTGVVSTYSIINSGYSGGIVTPRGDIYLIPCGSTVGQKISTLPAMPFNNAVCCSPFFNKF